MPHRPTRRLRVSCAAIPLFTVAPRPRPSRIPAINEAERTWVEEGRKPHMELSQHNGEADDQIKCDDYSQSLRGLCTGKHPCGLCSVRSEHYLACSRS